MQFLNSNFLEPQFVHRSACATVILGLFHMFLSLLGQQLVWFTTSIRSSKSEKIRKGGKILIILGLKFGLPDIKQDDQCENIPGLKCCEPVITKMHPTDFLRLILAEFAPLACRPSDSLACGMNVVGTLCSNRTLGAIHPRSNAA